MPQLDGIDVSMWQGVIDWSQVATLNLKFVCFQLGWRNDSGQRAAGVMEIDPQYRRNVERSRMAMPNAKKIHYVVPINKPWREQLDLAMQLMGPLPAGETMMFDVEYEHVVQLGFDNVVAMVREAEQRLQRRCFWYGGGYFPTNASWIEDDRIADIPKWFAAYSTKEAMLNTHAQGVENLVLWQWGGGTQGAFIPGIHNGTARVDSNEIINLAAFNAVFGGAPVAIDYRTKPEWGGKPPLWDAGDQPTDAEYAVIHHVGADHNPAALDTVAETDQYMRNLQAYAQRPKAQGGKGYSDLDYNIGVSPLGDAYEIRGWYEKSGATLDLNHKSYAILVIGGYTHNKLTTAQRQMVANVIVDGISRGRLRRTVKIIGHRDNPAHPGATSCPGDQAYAEIPWIKAEVARQLTAPNNPPNPPPSEVLNVSYVKASDQTPSPVYLLGGGGKEHISAARVPELIAIFGADWPNKVPGVTTAYLATIPDVSNVPAPHTHPEYALVAHSHPPLETVAPHTHVPGGVAH